MLFVTVAFLSLVQYLSTGNKIDLYFASSAVGFALLTKYTAIFLIPAFCLAILYKSSVPMHAIKQLRAHKREYIFAVLILLVMLAPVIIYNVHLFLLHGELDTALASVFGLPNILGRAPGGNFVLNQGEVLQVLFLTSSFPFISWCLISVGMVARKCQMLRGDIFEQSLIIFLFSLAFMFGFMGGATRWLPLFTPFFALAFGLGVVECGKRSAKSYINGIAWLILTFEFCYAVNTHLLLTPLGKPGVLYSSITREPSSGFNQLDAFLRSQFAPLPERRTPQSAGELFAVQRDTPSRGERESPRGIVAYDKRIDWFSGWWYLERYKIYYKEPIYLMSAKLAETGTSTQPILFIYPIDVRAVYAPWRRTYGNDSLDRLAKKLDTNHTPYVIITDDEGNPCFKIYTIGPR